MKLKHRITAVAAAAAVAVGGIAAFASPAGAAPPPISCSGHHPREDIEQPTGWCVSSDGVTISAGMKNVGEASHLFADAGWSPGRVKLVGFPDRGGIVVLAESGWSHSVPSGAVLTTPNVVWWVPGTVCALREILRGGQFYETTLMHCVRN